MRIFALELNNDIKGTERRKVYIEDLISKLERPDIVLLPELALCGYMASREAWKYADSRGVDASSWAMEMAGRYGAYIGVGYLDCEGGDYYNRYLLAGKDGVFGSVSKSEGEAAVFKRGWFDNIIEAPFGKTAVAICYDAKRRHFYENIKNEEISLIVFPHGCPADPRKRKQEQLANDRFCGAYAGAFGVPVVYVNSVGELAYMPGKMGAMMAKAGFRMNGLSKIYSKTGAEISCGPDEAVGLDADISPRKRGADIRFYGNDLVKGNWLFRKLVLEPDVRAGIREYKRYVGVGK